MLTVSQQTKVLDIINEYDLSEWMEVNDVGVRMKKLTSGASVKNRTLLMSIIILFILVKLLTVTKVPIFVYWMFGGIGLIWGLSIFYIQYRCLTFNLIIKTVELSILGMVLKKERMQSFEKFIFDGGFRVNGFDIGGNLYMEFKNGNRINIANLSDLMLLTSLNSAILELKEFDLM